MQEYIEVLEQQQSLKELAQVPFTLSLVLTILPKIITEIKKNNKSLSKLLTQKFSKYQVYYIFEQQFTQRELKRVLLIDQFKKALYAQYNFPLFNNDITKDEDKMKELLLKDLKLFH